MAWVYHDQCFISIENFIRLHDYLFVQNKLCSSFISRLSSWRCEIVIKIFVGSVFFKTKSFLHCLMQNVHVLLFFCHIC